MNSSKPTSRKNPRIPLANVAAVLAATSFMGQLLGFLRTKLVNANFAPTGPNSTDAYFAAFKIPDFFFFTLAAGALGVAFMPVLSDRLHKGTRKSVWQLSASLLNFLAIIMTVVAFIILIFARPLMAHLVAPNLAHSPAQLNQAVAITRILAFNPLLFTISGILTSVQQTMGRFFFFALAPLFYNLSVILSIYIFRNNIGLVGLGIGAAVGGILQLIVVMIGTINLNFHWHPHIDWKNAEFRQILRQLPPRSLDQGMDQLESIVETNFASRLGSGAVTYYNNAYILSTAPVLLIGTAISTAAFPRLNARLSQGRPDLFRKDFRMILRAIIWISMPVVIISYYTRGYLARLIFAKGNEQIALIFGFLATAIFFQVLYTIVSRWFYAQKDTKTPLFVSIFTITFDIILVRKLSQPSAYGVAGLAIAQSIVAATEVIILLIIMLYRDRELFNAAFWGGVIRTISVTGFSVVAGFIMVSLYPLGADDTGFVTLGGKLFLIAGVIFVVHIAMSALFGLEEVRPFLYRLKKLVLKPIQIN
jgi:putative peptidoglycan lipid II flippase